MKLSTSQLAIGVAFSLRMHSADCLLVKNLVSILWCYHQTNSVEGGAPRPHSLELAAQLRLQAQ